MELNDLINLEEYPEIINDKYIYENHCVPRVTEILSNMIHEDFLMVWSNNIGLYQRKKYKNVLQMASDKGSYTHNAIEQYIKHGAELDLDTIPREYRDEVFNSFYSFKNWWDIVNNGNKIEILLQESILVGKYFGGTLDLLVRINGKIYLVDFKTSNHPSYRYFLQLSAYRYLLFILMNISIDGCLILMLNKKRIYFEELLLDFSIQEHRKYIDNCQECFFSLVYAYYNRLRVESEYKDLF